MTALYFVFICYETTVHGHHRCIECLRIRHPVTMITPVSLRTQKQENFQFKASLTHIANPVPKTKIGYRLQEIQESRSEKAVGRTCNATARHFHHRKRQLPGSHFDGQNMATWSLKLSPGCCLASAVECF